MVPPTARSRLSLIGIGRGGRKDAAESDKELLGKGSAVNALRVRPQTDAHLIGKTTSVKYHTLPFSTFGLRRYQHVQGIYQLSP